MKQIHIRRFLSLLLAALTLGPPSPPGVILPPQPSSSCGRAAACPSRRCAGSWGTSSVWTPVRRHGDDAGPVPLLLAGRSTVAALLSAGVTRIRRSPAALSHRIRPPSADPSLTDGLTFADNGVPAQTTAPTSSKGYTVVNGVYLKNSSGTELDADASPTAALPPNSPMTARRYSSSTATAAKPHTMPAGQEYTPLAASAPTTMPATWCG